MRSNDNEANGENCLNFLLLSFQQELTVVHLLLEGVKKTWQFHFFVRLNSEIVLYVRHMLSFPLQFFKHLLQKQQNHIVHHVYNINICTWVHFSSCTRQH